MKHFTANNHRQRLDVLDRARDAPTALDLIAERGGVVIPAAENRQPQPDLKVASVRFAGIIGIGAHLHDAAQSWIEQAVGSAAPIAG